MQDDIFELTVKPSKDDWKADDLPSAFRATVSARLLSEVSQVGASDLSERRRFNPDVLQKHRLDIEFEQGSVWSSEALSIFVEWLCTRQICSAANGLQASVLYEVLFAAWELGGIMEAPTFQDHVARAIAHLLDNYKIKPGVRANVVRRLVFEEDVPLSRLWAYHVWFTMMEDSEVRAVDLNEYFARDEMHQRVHEQLNPTYGSRESHGYLHGHCRCFQAHIEFFLIPEPTDLRSNLRPAQPLRAAL